MTWLNDEGFLQRRQKMKKTVFVLVAAWVLFGPYPAEAQKVHRIGSLVATDMFIPAYDGFKKRMAELGYIEGKNIRYEFHNANGEPNALKALAEKLVKDKYDVIVTSSTTATAPVAKATAGSNIPVVFLSSGNPLEFVKSYASSGNNITGISSSSLDLIDKRMELLKELAPGTKQVIALHVPSGINYEETRRLTLKAARKLGLALVEVEPSGYEEIKSKMSAFVSHKLGDAVFLPSDAAVIVVVEEIAQQAIKERLPVVGPNIENVKRGVLAAYSSDYFALGQQGAVLVDKILKGARPTDLPIEQPYKLKLALNLKTAKAIGLKLPKEILLRANEVIE
jgi:putative tryptophan/tyrosine transport system substrate-binding protein